MSAASSSLEDGPTEIELFWGKERFRIPMPPLTTNLAHLKAKIYNLTGITPENQKLIASGAILKDDLASLSSFGIFSSKAPAAAASASSNGEAKRSFWESWGFGKRKTVKLVLVGNNDNIRTRRPDLEQQQQAQKESTTAPAPEDEATVVKRIQAITRGVESDWSPAIDRYETYMTNPSSTAATTSATAENESSSETAAAAAASKAPSGTATPTMANLAMNERTSAVLSETLLQQLLKLDSIQVGPGMEQARKERKDAVRLVQAALDRVDKVKNSGSSSKKQSSQ